MPNKDRYHDVVVRALNKGGWTVVREQVFIKLPERRLWVDIEAVYRDGTVLVEVKSYTGVRSPVESLVASVGKYVMYRAALDHIKDMRQLYLAIPDFAYKGIFSETLGQAVTKRAGIPLLVYDPIKEEITRWIP